MLVMCEELRERGRMLIRGFASTPDVRSAILAGTLGRATASWGLIIGLVSEGHGPQAAMLLRSLFEDVEVAHWATTYRGDDQVLQRLFEDHDDLQNLRLARLGGASAPDDMTDSRARRRPLAQVRQESWRPLNPTVSRRTTQSGAVGVVGSARASGSDRPPHADRPDGGGLEQRHAPSWPVGAETLHRARRRRELAHLHRADLAPGMGSSRPRIHELRTAALPGCGQVLEQPFRQPPRVLAHGRGRAPSQGGTCRSGGPQRAGS